MQRAALDIVELEFNLDFDGLSCQRAVPRSVMVGRSGRWVGFGRARYGKALVAGLVGASTPSRMDRSVPGVDELGRKWCPSRRR